MVTKERIHSVAPCGIDCGICELHTCSENDAVYSAMIARGIPAEKLPCKGCRSVQGMCPVIVGKCATYTCITNRGFSYCYECGDFPCNMLHPSADRANVLPHNLKVFQLCSIMRDGIEKFIERSPDMKKKYYTGKMEVGKGPQA